MTQESAPIVDREKDFAVLWEAGDKIVRDNPDSAYTISTGTYYAMSFNHKDGHNYPVKFVNYTGNIPEGAASFVVEDEAPNPTYIRLTEINGETRVTSNLLGESETTHVKSPDRANVIEVYPNGDSIGNKGLNTLYAILHDMRGVANAGEELRYDLESVAVVVFPSLSYDQKIGRIKSLITELARGETRRVATWNQDGLSHEIGMIENEKHKSKEIQLVLSGGVVKQDDVLYKNREIWGFTPQDDTAYMQVLTLPTDRLFKQRGKVRERSLRTFKSSEEQIMLDRGVLGQQLYEQRVMQGRNILLKPRS